MSFRNTILKTWFSQRARAIDRFRRHPVETQERMLRRLVRRGRLTEFGDRYDLRHIHSVERFQSQVETFDYETFKPYVERMMAGVRSVTAPGHDLRPQQVHPRHAGVVVVESYAGYA